MDRGEGNGCWRCVRVGTRGSAGSGRGHQCRALRPPGCAPDLVGGVGGTGEGRAGLGGVGTGMGAGVGIAAPGWEGAGGGGCPPAGWRETLSEDVWDGKSTFPARRFSDKN